MKMTVTIRLEEEVNKQLDKLAYYRNQSKGAVITDALEALVKSPKEEKKNGKEKVK